MVTNIKERSIDPASQEMLAIVHKAGLETAWDRLEKQQPQCGFGELGLCCRNCNMGPCRIDPFGEAATKGVCGATADIIVARNLLQSYCRRSFCPLGPREGCGPHFQADV